MGSLRIVLCGALVCGIVATGGPAAVAGCETVWAPVYDVDVDARRDVYRIGDTALIDVTVTRTDTGEPVGGATATAYFRPTRHGFLWGGAYTDDSGHALARLKLKRNHVRPGTVTLFGQGQKEAADAADCAQVYEYGETRVEEAFVVKR